jgi:hypothetical protein
LSLATIAAGLPARAFSASRSIRARTRSCRAKGATERRLYRVFFENPVRKLKSSDASWPNSARAVKRPTSVYTRAVSRL